MGRAAGSWAFGPVPLCLLLGNRAACYAAGHLLRAIFPRLTSCAAAVGNSLRCWRRGRKKEGVWGSSAPWLPCRIGPSAYCYCSERNQTRPHDLKLKRSSLLRCVLRMRHILRVGLVVEPPFRILPHRFLQLAQRRRRAQTTRPPAGPLVH